MTVYCLDKCVRRKAGGSLRHVWTQYATCGSRALLERVRVGQPHPEHWRVTMANAAGGGCSEEMMMKKSG